jgi:nucleoid-associated protein YgaU
VSSQQVNYTITFVYHQVTAVDTVDGLAATYYNDPTLWWRIADANPEIMLWDTLAVGSLIRIPNSV